MRVSRLLQSLLAFVTQSAHNRIRALCQLCLYFKIVDAFLGKNSARFSSAPSSLFQKSWIKWFFQYINIYSKFYMLNLLRLKRPHPIFVDANVSTYLSWYPIYGDLLEPGAVECSFYWLYSNIQAYFIKSSPRQQNPDILDGENKKLHRISNKTKLFFVETSRMETRAENWQKLYRNYSSTNSNFLENCLPPISRHSQKKKNREPIQNNPLVNPSIDEPRATSQCTPKNYAAAAYKAIGKRKSAASACTACVHTERTPKIHDPW